jgi:hypothetical protein
MLFFIIFFFICVSIRYRWESERFNNVYKQMPGSIGPPIIGYGLLLLKTSSGNRRTKFNSNKWE